MLANTREIGLGVAELAKGRHEQALATVVARKGLPDRDGGRRRSLGRHRQSASAAAPRRRRRQTRLLLVPRGQNLVCGGAGPTPLLEGAALHALIRCDRHEVSSGAAIARLVATIEEWHPDPIAEADRQSTRYRAVRDDRGKLPILRRIEMAPSARPDVRQKRHVVATSGSQLGQHCRQPGQRRSVDEQVGAPALAGFGQKLGRLAPGHVVVDGEPYLPESPRELWPRRRTKQGAVGRHVLRQSRCGINLSHQLVEAPERKRFATTVCDLERARVTEATQDRRSARHRPRALPRYVARTELARQIASVCDPEHRHPRRTTEQVPSRHPADAHVDAGCWLKIQRCAVERIGAEHLSVHHHFDCSFTYSSMLRCAVNALARSLGFQTCPRCDAV
jgi:hypothetical protein